jgi:hypothetical protein
VLRERVTFRRVDRSDGAPDPAFDDGGDQRGSITAGAYAVAEANSPTAACPAASLAVSTRNGEQLT